VELVLVLVTAPAYEILLVTWRLIGWYTSAGGMSSLVSVRSLINA
jgi:hypothetical protein